MKATLIEITIYREIRVAWMKQRIKSMIWNIKKKKKQPNRTTTRRKKPQNEDSRSNLCDFTHSNIHITGVSEREEKEQEIENLFEKNNNGRKCP